MLLIVVRLLNCDALRAVLRPGLDISYLNKFQHPLKINVFSHILKTEFHLIGITFI